MRDGTYAIDPTNLFNTPMGPHTNTGVGGSILGAGPGAPSNPPPPERGNGRVPGANGAPNPPPAELHMNTESYSRSLPSKLVLCLVRGLQSCRVLPLQLTRGELASLSLAQLMLLEV